MRRLVDSTRGIILLMFDQEDGNRKVFTSVFLWVSVQAPNTVIESPRLPSRASGYNGNVIVVKGDGGWLIFVFWRRRRTEITPYCDHQRCRYLITSNKTWKFVKILFEVSIFFLGCLKILISSSPNFKQILQDRGVTASTSFI